MVQSRSKVLLTLGLSEDDIKTSETLFQQLPLPPMNPGCQRILGSPDPTKIEKLMGYATRTLRREKALKVLGTSEEDLEVENSKNLGALGRSGRRRSYLDNVMYENQNPNISSAKCLHKRRRSSLDKHSSYMKKSKRRGTRTGKLFRSKSAPKLKRGLRLRFSESKNVVDVEEMNRLKTILFQTHH